MVDMGKRLLAIDPGKTTGYALFIGKTLREYGTVEGSDTYKLLDLLPDIVIIESFRLYPWKANQQSFSSFETVEIIGVLKFLCEQKGISYIMQPATIKTVWPDERLKSEGYYVKNRHSRDAVRHGLYYVFKKGW